MLAGGKPHSMLRPRFLPADRIIDLDTLEQYSNQDGVIIRSDPTMTQPHCYSSPLGVLRRSTFVVAALLLVGCQPLQSMRPDDFGCCWLRKYQWSNQAVTTKKTHPCYAASKIDANETGGAQVYGMRSEWLSFERRSALNERTTVLSMVLLQVKVRSYPVGDSYGRSFQLDIRKMEQLAITEV